VFVFVCVYVCACLCVCAHVSVCLGARVGGWAWVALVLYIVLGPMCMCTQPEGS
jgi:hypothetical protein